MASLISRLLGATNPSGNPWDDVYFGKSGGGGQSAYGGYVSADTAMRIAAVYRCVSLIANILAMLPVGVYEELDPSGRRRAREQPMDFKLRLRPNPRQSSFEFRRQLYLCLLLRQNAYCQMVPEGGGFDLYPIHPDRITKGPEITAGGELRYEYTPPKGRPIPMLGGVDLWHLKGLSEDGLKGLSLVDLGKDTFGLAQAADAHAARFYERGVSFPGVLQHKARLQPTTAAEMGDSFGRRYGGQAGAGKIPVLWDGMEFKPIGMTMKDAEFLDSRKYSVNEIARLFGVPPHLIADVEKSTSWGTGIEEQNLGFLVYTLLPWITLFEQSARHDLILDPERYFVAFNVNALLRASAKTRFEVYALAITNGILSPNECRELEDRNPRDGGDEFLTPLNMQQGSVPPPAPPGAPEDRALVAVAQRLAGELERQPEAVAERVVAGIEASAEARAREAAAQARARELARLCADRVVDHEVHELRALLEKAAGDNERWRHAVASFYGRYSAFVAQAMGIPGDAARGYCRDQQDEATGNRLPAKLEPWREARIERLVGLAVASPAAALALHAHVDVVVPERSVTVEGARVEVPAAAPAPVHVAAPSVTVRPALLVQEGALKVEGPVDVRVKEMPDKETDVERDRDGRIKRTRERSKK